MIFMLHNQIVPEYFFIEGYVCPLGKNVRSLNVVLFGDTGMIV